MRQSFHLVRGPGAAEEFRTLRLLAERIHQLRGLRDLHLRNASLGGHPELEGRCVAVHAGQAMEDLIGYVFSPETLAYRDDAARQLLIEQLHALRPDLERGATAEVVDFTDYKGKAA